MTTMTQKRISTNTLFTALTAALILAAFPAVSNADGWELRTSRHTVPGTQEIESGRIDKAIQISRVQLPHVSQQKKVAVLTNLCIAYILSNEFDQAEDYCDQATERSNEKTVSYNNRGVLKAAQGDFDSAMQDFAYAASAGCINGCNSASNGPRDLPQPVAKRNLGRAEYWAKASKSNDQEQMAARSD